MKKSKKMIACLAASIITIMSVISVSAVQSPGKYTGSKTLKYNKSTVKTEFTSKLSWPSVVNKCRWSGTSSTTWYGVTPFNADSIRHTNSIYVGGVGSFSLGSDSAGCEISGSTIDDVMEVSNKWRIESNYTYDVKRSIFITSTDFSVSGRVQFGSNFYSLSCGT